MEDVANDDGCLIGAGGERHCGGRQAAILTSAQTRAPKRAAFPLLIHFLPPDPLLRVVPLTLPHIPLPESPKTIPPTNVQVARHSLP